MSNEATIRELLRETPLTAAQAANHCGVSSAALMRWIRKGKRIGGVLVRLKGYPAGDPG